MFNTAIGVVLQLEITLNLILITSACSSDAERIIIITYGHLSKISCPQNIRFYAIDLKVACATTICLRQQYSCFALVLHARRRYLVTAHSMHLIITYANYSHIFFILSLAFMCFFCHSILAATNKEACVRVTSSIFLLQPYQFP